MKKIILSITAIFLFAAMPAFAQNAQRKANEINAAGKSAVQSQSATESRSINNAAWDGSGSGSGTPEGKNGTIDIIGGNNSDERTEDNPSTIDKPESEDVSPWKNLITAMMATLAAASALLAAAAAVMIRQTSFMASSRTLMEIGQRLAYAAIPVFAAVLAMSVVLMVKHKQYLLGGLWAGIATIGIAAAVAMSITSCPGGCTKEVWYRDYVPQYVRSAVIGIIMALTGFAGGGTLSYYSYKNADDAGSRQQNTDNQEKTSSAQSINKLYLS